MFDACLPLGPWTTSKLTLSPSFSDLKPAILMAEKCAKRSSLPSSGVMKPKPLASLNHLTVPVAILLIPSSKTDKSATAAGVKHRTPAGACLKQNWEQGNQATNQTNCRCWPAQTRAQRSLQEARSNTIRVLPSSPTSVKNFRCCNAHTTPCIRRKRLKVRHHEVTIPPILCALKLTGIALQSRHGNT